MRRLLGLSLVLGMAVAGTAIAEELTRNQIINRSAPICRALLDAVEPHVERAEEARAKGQWDRFIREARRAIRTARPYGRELRSLQPATGARRYARFLKQGRRGLDSLGRALDALEAGREELALQRQATAQEHFRRARRAARRYGLRRPCIKVVS